VRGTLGSAAQARSGAEPPAPHRLRTGTATSHACLRDFLGPVISPRAAGETVGRASRATITMRTGWETRLPGKFYGETCVPKFLHISPVLRSRLSVAGQFGLSVSPALPPAVTARDLLSVGWWARLKFCHGWISASQLSGRLELTSDVWPKASTEFLGLMGTKPQVSRSKCLSPVTGCRRTITTGSGLHSSSVRRSM
jgi:hypothetical protein